MTCDGLGAEPLGTLVQRDTYFEARKGRLKLRQEEGATPQLIAYERPNEREGRESRYWITEVAQSEALTAALSATLGVKAVVTKHRQLFLWQGVRLHLDRIESLGNFLEFEAVAAPDSDLAKKARQVQYLREAFEIDDVDLIGLSYCDLISTNR